MKIDRPPISTPSEPVQEEKPLVPAPPIVGGIFWGPIGSAIDSRPDPVLELKRKASPKTDSVEIETKPVELQRNPAPKTDSVEMQQNSNPIFENVASKPTLDAAQTSINPNQFPAALIPGVPFREKAELPKTLPNGTSVDSGVGSGDLGFGKTRPGPNHMGADLGLGRIGSPRTPRGIAISSIAASRA